MAPTNLQTAASVSLSSLSPGLTCQELAIDTNHLTSVRRFLRSLDIWSFLKMGVPKNGGFIREKPIKIDDLGRFGVPLFQETSIYVFL